MTISLDLENLSDDDLLAAWDKGWRDDVRVSEQRKVHNALRREMKRRRRDLRDMIRARLTNMDFNDDAPTIKQLRSAIVALGYPPNTRSPGL